MREHKPSLTKQLIDDMRLTYPMYGSMEFKTTLKEEGCMGPDAPPKRLEQFDASPTCPKCRQNKRENITAYYQIHKDGDTLIAEWITWTCTCSYQFHTEVADKEDGKE